jgi:hypothetical protein
MKYNGAKQLDNLYKGFLIRDNFNKFLYEKNKIDFYKRQTHYKDYTLIEYNTNKSAGHPIYRMMI